MRHVGHLPRITVQKCFLPNLKQHILIIIENVRCLSQIFIALNKNKADLQVLHYYYVSVLHYKRENSD